jgi:hypothetical protein
LPKELPGHGKNMILALFARWVPKGVKLDIKTKVGKVREDEEKKEK